MGILRDRRSWTRRGTDSTPLRPLSGPPSAVGLAESQISGRNAAGATRPTEVATRLAEHRQTCSWLI